MRKFIIALCIPLLLIGAEILVARHLKPDAPTTVEAVREVGVDVLAHAVAQGMRFRIHFPQKVDDTTYLEGVHAEQNAVVYQLSTNKYGEEFDQMMKSLHDNTQQSGCSREDYRQLLSYGLAIVIEYKSANGQTARPIDITPQMCGAQ